MLASPLMLAAIGVMAAGLSRSGRRLHLPAPGRVILTGVALALAPVALVMLLYLAGLLRSYP